jgi:hypothetical protein
VLPELVEGRRGYSHSTPSGLPPFEIFPRFHLGLFIFNPFGVAIFENGRIFGTSRYGGFYKHQTNMKNTL